ncbi:MAG: hypothetical protein IJ506_02660 [Clostridia bacterium]|nr:hypothetical protein [Clostridia bacterium]
MKKLASEETLAYMIRLLGEYLAELSTPTAGANADFVAGEKTAYAECLEILQSWELAEKYGLTYSVEDRFPLPL